MKKEGRVKIDKEEKLWFKAKCYGWGWYPASSEGWSVLFIYLIAVILLAFIFKDNLIIFFLSLIILGIIFVLICYKKGEKPCWRWGKSSKKIL